MEEKLYIIDGIYWQVDQYNEVAIPICPNDRTKLSASYDFRRIDDPFLVDEGEDELKCEDCGRIYKIKHSFWKEKECIIEKVRAIDRKCYKIIDIDGIQTPVTKKSKIDLNNGYFCSTQIHDSKRGPQLVIYAGKKGLTGKSQIFVSEKERRLSFDYKDINPADVFTRITAEFRDGTKHTIEKND